MATKKPISECLRPRSPEEAVAELRTHLEAQPPRAVVFLDFDGVLNTRPWTERPGYLERPLDPDLVTRLGQLVAAAGAEVVLSSSWRSEGLEACRRHLQVAGFPSAERVVAVTAAASPWGGRAHEILDWVELHEVERFVVLDDDPSLTEVADHHVWTDPEVGLTAANVEAALAVLGRMPDPRPTLVHFGAPLMWRALREMELEDAVVAALPLMAEDPTVLLSLPVVLAMNAASLQPERLLAAAGRLALEAELGMVLDLTAALGGSATLGALASHLHGVEGEPRYLERHSSPLARQAADERTPAVVARWGFRVNMPESSFRQFFAKRLGPSTLMAEVDREKAAARAADRLAVERGEATVEELERRNGLFPGEAVRVDWDSGKHG